MTFLCCGKHPKTFSGTPALSPLNSKLSSPVSFPKVSPDIASVHWVWRSLAENHCTRLCHPHLLGLPALPLVGNLNISSSGFLYLPGYWLPPPDCPIYSLRQADDCGSGSVTSLSPPISTSTTTGCLPTPCTWSVQNTLSPCTISSPTHPLDIVVYLNFQSTSIEQGLGLYYCDSSP